jgi:hypothetical protein
MNPSPVWGRRGNLAAGAAIQRPALGGGVLPYDLTARIAAFNARVIAIRTAAGVSAVSAYAGLQLPEPPVTTSTGTCSTNAHITDALMTSGLDVTIAPGFYTKKFSWGTTVSHQRWSMPTDGSVVINAPADDFVIEMQAPHHIEINGGVWVGGVLAQYISGGNLQAGGSHIKFKNTDIRSRVSTASYFDAHAFTRFDHVLIERSYWYARCGTAHNYGCQHFIIANCNFVNPATDDGTIESTFRFGGGGATSDLNLIMDCRGFNGVKANFRGHSGNNRLAYFANQFEGGGGLFGTPGEDSLQNSDLYLIDNAVYHIQFNSIQYNTIQ